MLRAGDWDDPERWGWEGGRREDQDGEPMAVSYECLQLKKKRKEKKTCYIKKPNQKT